MTFLSRRALLGAAAAVPALAGLPLPVSAAASTASGMAATLARNSGAIRRRLGDVEVVALSDGYLDIDTSLLQGADSAEVQRLMAGSFRPAGPYRAAVNAYLVRSGDNTVLIDTGTSNAMGPTLGRLPRSLADAGVAPQAVTAVAMTHLHPDHANGLVTADGAAAFPNAELIVAETEWAFWTDEAAASRAPKDMQPFFVAAQRAVAPYRERLRLIKGEAAVVPGMTALPLPGHTPGHTGFRVASGAEQLLIWGDILHTAALQLAHPDWSIAFDTDATQAVATRKRALDMVAADRVLVAGMHMDFPGFGYIARTGDAYAQINPVWSYE